MSCCIFILTFLAFDLPYIIRPNIETLVSNLFEFTSYQKPWAYAVILDNPLKFNIFINPK